MHSFFSVCSAFAYILRLFCGARRNRWGRRVLARISSALGSTLRREGGTSHNTAANGKAEGARMLRKDNATRVTARTFCSQKLGLISRKSAAHVLGQKQFSGNMSRKIIKWTGMFRTRQLNECFLLFLSVTTFWNYSTIKHIALIQLSTSPVTLVLDSFHPA